jgi:nucleoside-diphosphate-sugar epimerase
MILITGGTGFIGSYVARDLLARGAKVTLVDLKPDLDTLRLVCGEDVEGRVAIVAANMSVGSEVTEAIALSRPEVVVHLASLLPPEAERSTEAALAGITGSHVATLEASRLFGVKRLIWASATSVFGPPERHGGIERTVGDDAPHWPVTLYGIAKSANERLGLLYRERHGLDCIGFRFCQGYGPGKRRGRPFGYQMFEKAILGEPYAVPYGDDIINWQYVEDIAQILMNAIDMPYRGIPVYNTSGEVLSMRETLEILRELAPRAKIEANPGTAGLVWRYAADALARDNGFRNATPVREGFARTLDTMKAWQQLGRW